MAVKRRQANKHNCIPALNLPRKNNVRKQSIKHESTQFARKIKLNVCICISACTDSSEYASDTAKQAIIVKVGVCSFLQHDITHTVTMFPINPDVNVNIICNIKRYVVSLNLGRNEKVTSSQKSAKSPNEKFVELFIAATWKVK